VDTKRIENYKMFNQNFKVMKQKIFTLVMMLALVIVANSAFAAPDTTPYKGGNYPYTVDISLLGSTGVHVADATFDYTPSTGVTVPGTRALTPDSTSINFRVGFGLTSGNGILTVTITYVGAGGCSNNIQLTITPQDPPTMNIAISTLNTGGCQNDLDTPITDGSADNYNGGTNSVTYTVATAGGPSGVASISYTLGVSGHALTTDPSGAQTATGDFTAEFTTTEGAGFTLTGSIAAGATFTMNAANGGGTYSLTRTTPSVGVTYNDLPTIGAFN